VDKLKDYQILIVGVVFSLSILLCVYIALQTLSRNGIDVTGSAEEIIKSDRAVWKIEVTTQEPTKVEAFNKLKKHIDLVQKYLIEQGIKPEEIEALNTNSYPVYKLDLKTGRNTNEVEYYVFSQIYQITSNNIDKIKELSINAEALLSKGIDVKSFPPNYFYSKLDELKPQLLQAATKNAKVRAEAMLSNTGNKVGAIQSAKSGVFQITQVDSTEVSNYGIHDTSSIDKKVTAVVQAKFKIK